MGQPACSDKEFIALWNTHHSANLVAKSLGVAPVNVHSRKRRIEKRYSIRLATIDPRRPSYDQSMLITADRVEVKLTLRNGVILVGGDFHFWPGCVPTMHRAFCFLAKKYKPFATIWNGDAFDGASISRFPDIGWEKKPTVKQELEAVRDRSAEVMTASPNSKRIWCAGNHDLRAESRLASVVPEFGGVKGFHLKDHVPEWIPAWFVTVNGGTDSHTEIRHRERGGIHASYLNTVHSGVTIVTGHDHVADVKRFVDRRGWRYGVRHGMGADAARDPQFVNYLEGRTPSWSAGLALLTYKDGKLLQPELALRWDEDHFEFRGEIIRC